MSVTNWKKPIQLLLGLFDPAPDREAQPSAAVDFGKSRPQDVPSKSGEIQSKPISDHNSGSVSGWDHLSSEVRFEFLPRLQKTWRLNKSKGRLVCQLPKVFVNAPDSIRQDMMLWIHSVTHPSPVSRRRKREAQTRLFEWLSPLAPDKIPKGQAKGKTWDLRELFDGLNQAYFQGQLQAVVRWSPQVGGLSTHRKIQKDQTSHHILTISRAYDGPGVPRVAVEGVLYHEMCHIAYPPRQGQGSRRHVHHKAFREAERRFAGFAAWREWEAKHLHRELRILRKGLRLGQK